jgi:methylenetetrahydrofolate dehydrogenase (NADP+)/methenyltetrahydrofolate cyclohydrolase
MTAELIDGKAIAAGVRADVARGVALLTQTAPAPGLATVLVGSDPASEVYVRNKRRLCVEAGMLDLHRWVPGDSSQELVADLISELALDPAVSGILLQLPLPDHLDAEALIDLIPAAKDVDGLTTSSAGLLATGRAALRPCTPAGVVELLDRTSITISGKHAVVVGRSALVGRPLSTLLLQRDATVTVCHSRTTNLSAVCREADILVVAAGRPRLVSAESVRPGAVVIDVGIHRTDAGLVGDVAFEEVVNIAGHLTPVPGGVGPMTIAMLLKNTLEAARSASTVSGRSVDIAGVNS